MTRFRELNLVVFINLLLILILNLLLSNFSIDELPNTPTLALLIAVAIDRLAVGSLMNVTVFLKTYQSPRIIALIRTLTIVSSTLMCCLAIVFHLNLILLILVTSTPYGFVACILSFKIFKIFRK